MCAVTPALAIAVSQVEAAVAMLRQQLSSDPIDLFPVAEQCARVLASVRDLERTAVADLRAAGFPWSEVGRALGISKQSAHQRFGSRLTRTSANQAARPPTIVSHPMPSNRELDWLGQLAEGTTVAQLAERSGYSERAMFRLLRNLYNQLNVRNRTEALQLAQDRGWL
jgi:DNA-binding CsgD family transcriptional regulator